MLSILQNAGLIAKVQDYFAPWITTVSQSEVTFSYGDDEPALEKFGLNGHMIPVTAGMWTAGALHCDTVRHSFLFFSALEALSFCSVNSVWLEKPGNCVFSALGILPSSQQISRLQSRFPNARFHAVYGNDLLGRVMDCKTALWSKERDAAFYLYADFIDANYRGKSFRIPEQLFSLNHFQQQSGLRAGTRTHKPKNGYSSFFELVSRQP